MAGSAQAIVLNILIMTYDDGRPFQPVHGDVTIIQQIRAALIEPYVSRQLQSAPARAPYGNSATRRYLSWLGWQMRTHEQTIFYVEMMQVDWLTKRRLSHLFLLSILLVGAPSFGLVTGLLGWLLFGLIVTLNSGLFGGFYIGFRIGLVFWLVGGLWGVLIFGRKTINLQQKLNLNFRKGLPSLRKDLIFVSLSGIIFMWFGQRLWPNAVASAGLVFGLGLALTFWLSSTLRGSNIRSYVVILIRDSTMR